MHIVMKRAALTTEASSTFNRSGCILSECVPADLKFGLPSRFGKSGSFKWHNIRVSVMSFMCLIASKEDYEKSRCREKKRPVLSISMRMLFTDK